MKTLNITLNDEQYQNFVNMMNLAVEGAKNIAAQKAAAETTAFCQQIFGSFEDKVEEEQKNEEDKNV